MEDVSDIEMEVDKDEEAIDDGNSEVNRNVEFEEEVIIFLYFLIIHIFCDSGKNINGEEKL